MKRSTGPAERNRGPILEVLQRRLGPSGLLLEIAGGNGVHALHFARGLPDWTIQSSDPDEESLLSARAWHQEEGPANLLPPLRFDATAPSWPVARADAIVCINMVHISPIESTYGLLDGAARVLTEGGLLFLYGPYHVDGKPTSEGNRSFDAWLRDRDPSYGIRDRGAMTEWAAERGLTRVAAEPMPANNFTLVFRLDSRTG